MFLPTTIQKIGVRLCCCQVGASSSAGHPEVLARLLSTDANGAELALNRRRPYKPRGINPSDQFGLLCRGGDMPQTEKLNKVGFENPWLTKQTQAEQLLARETTQASQKWELNADKFANVPVITVPYSVKKKMEKQKRREVQEYMKAISIANKFKNE